MDARSLLRAKKAEGKVQDPNATYTTSGQLKCSICAVPVKEWGAHVMTKQHRQSVTREKTQSKSKRPASGDGVGESSKRSKTEDEVIRSSILPAGFFSNGSGPTIVPDEDEEDEAEAAAAAPVLAPTTSKVASSGATPIAPAAAAGSSTTTTTTTTVPGQTGDVELDDFLASLAEPEPDLEPTPSTTNVNASKAKTSSVIKKTTTSYKDVIPGQASYEAAPVRNIPKEDDQSKEEVQPEESESDKRARLAREEREEMMDRLDEETRAQEDADQRVAALKARMEALKKRREARAPTKAGSKANGGKSEA